MEIENEEVKEKPKIPIPVRWEIVHYKRLGYTGDEVAQILPASAASCNRIYRTWQETGDVIDQSRTGRPKKYTEEDEEMIIECLEENPDMCINTIIEESKLDIPKMTGWRIDKMFIHSHFVVLTHGCSYTRVR